MFVRLAFLVLVLLSGCGARRSRSPEAFDRRQEDVLRRTAANDLGCPRSLVTVSAMSGPAAEARGCGRIREYYLTCSGRRRCRWMGMDPAAALAERDLACPLESMTVTAVSPTLRDLSGCGRVARYQLGCEATVGCHWTHVTYPVVAASVPAAPPGYEAPLEPLGTP